MEGSKDLVPDQDMKECADVCLNLAHKLETKTIKQKDKIKIGSSGKKISLELKVCKLLKWDFRSGIYVLIYDLGLSLIEVCVFFILNGIFDVSCSQCFEQVMPCNTVSWKASFFDM